MRSTERHEEQKDRVHVFEQTAKLVAVVLLSVSGAPPAEPLLAVPVRQALSRSLERVLNDGTFDDI